MATAAEIQTAYKALYRADLNATVAKAIADSGIALDAYIARELPSVSATTQAAVAIVSFITGVTPTSDKLDALKVDADKQVAYYTSIGAANPSLGAFEAFGRALSVDSTTKAGFTSSYGALSTADFINAVYAKVYGVTPSAAALASLTGQIDYFTKLYTDAGLTDASLQAKGAVLGQIVGYAFTTSASANSLLDNQVVAALTAAASGDATVYGKALPPDPSSLGKTITLTAGNDTVSPTSTSADFKSTTNNDTINAGTAGFWAATDTIDGGAGVDTLNATIGADVTVAENGLKSVEKLFVTADNAWTVDVEKATSTTEVWNKASGANVLTFDKVALTTTVGMTGSITGNAVFKFAGATSSSDAATLALNAAVGGGTAVIDDIEALTVSTTGTSTLAAINGTTLKAVTVSGSGSVTSNFATTVETITNAGTGGVTTDLTTLNAIKTYAGGTGKDGVTLDGVHTNDVTINVGAGNDTVILTAGDSTKAVTITLGAGNDQLTTNGQLGNAVATPNTNAKILSTLITVTDFNTAEDAIKFDATTAGTAGREVLSNTEIANIEAATDLLGALNVVVATTAANNYTVFGYKGDTYIFDNGGNAALGTEDTLIKLTGVAVASLNATNLEVV